MMSWSCSHFIDLTAVVIKQFKWEHQVERHFKDGFLTQWAVVLIMALMSYHLLLILAIKMMNQASKSSSTSL